MMKTKLLMLILFLGFTEIYAQNISVPGIVKGKNAAYRCTKDNEYMIKVRNVKNTDTTAISYYTDGTIVLGEDTSYALCIREQAMYQAFRELVTNQELELLKKQRGGPSLIVVADSNGNTTELTFHFIKTDPVMTKMNPDRLFLLEQKLKSILKLRKTDFRLKSIRNPKYWVGITYNKLK